ncbi:DUF2732 domain-containing protein [Serratia quinivorans]|uniref:DUF2732 domain-containing protein n=1 Tax=Serratia quinivorans TaxID=137545 RepID=UPI00217B799E|nr:DUF2732 domain-containing protein [Serratia quinivorans]CAI0764339.1 Protein of uncharacterised function (DUF2732) [Serratia quinivorans]CAI2049015.1 Protein of uncharacterised function (DUF2732) [Serratia quinivorans]
MRNIQKLPIAIGIDHANRSDVSVVHQTTYQLEEMLKRARMDERKNQAEVMSTKLENLANSIIAKDLSLRDAVELLRHEAEFIQNQAMELH